MRSAARSRPGKVLGILLTGMGEDGAEGMATIRAGGGVTIAESESSCVVYGMPRAAVQRGGAGWVLPLSEIAAAAGAGRGMAQERPVAHRSLDPAQVVGIAVHDRAPR